MEEWFLLDGIKGNTRRVSEWDIQHAVPVEADAADAIVIGCDLAAMSARDTAHPFVGHGLGEIAFCGT
jgi:hypothetical protein